MIKIVLPLIMTVLFFISCSAGHTGAYVPREQGGLIDGIYVIEKIEIGIDEAVVHLAVSGEKMNIVKNSDDPDLADCIRIASKNRTRSYPVSLEGNRLVLKKKNGSPLQHFEITGDRLTAPEDSLYGGIFIKKL